MASTSNSVSSASVSASTKSSQTPSNSISSPSGTVISIPVKDGINIEMVKVEAGTFMMGATPEMGIASWKEKPVHKVTLTKNYYVGKYEVTQALWQVVMGENPSECKGSDLPVEQISWNDCQKFIVKLNMLTGKIFRLPTEAEWEYAARGGNKSQSYIYSGSNTLDDVAWYGGKAGTKPHVVGTKQPNELGLYDMSGNVWEWCQDYYSDYNSSSQINPLGNQSMPFKKYRVERGGCWFNEADFCRSSFRIYGRYDERKNCVGLRLVLSE